MPSVRAWQCGSGSLCSRFMPGVAILSQLCPQLTPSLPFLSMRFAIGTRPGLTFLLGCFALGSHPAFRFCRSSVLGSSCLCDSAAVLCPRHMPGIAVLAQLLALGSRPALRFWRNCLSSAHARRCGFVAALPAIHAQHCGSGATVCPRLTPSIAILVQLFALGTRPGLAFLLLHLPWFTPVFFLIEEKETACDVLRFYFRRVEIAFVRSRGVVRLSAFVGSLRV